MRGLFDGVLGVLPQNPQSIFVRKTVEEDLLEMFSGRKTPKAERYERVRAAAPDCAFMGGLTTFAIYGFIMNTASLFMFQANQTRTMLSSAITQGIPFDLVHALGTVVFLFVISRPMLEKLDRIKLKYGLI